MERAEWERRYKAHIVERCTSAKAAEHAKQHNYEPWTVEEAERAAQGDLDGAGYEYLVESFEEDPERSADESMSNWDD